MTPTPALADDADDTVRAGRDLFTTADRPNVLIRVPGSSAGLVAVKELTASSPPRAGNSAGTPRKATDQNDSIDRRKLMLGAVYHGQVLAETPRTVRLEGNHYFPPDSLHHAHLIESRTRTLCPWKGIAHYYTVVTDEGALPDADGW